MGVALLFAVGLAFTNLSSQVLWQDEAQSALLGRTTLANGVPLGTDGQNSLSQELGAEFDETYRWRWHPWLHFYLVAGSFGLFGESTSSARWPGALFGVLTVFAVYRLAREWWDDRLVARGATLTLLLFVPFWVLARQSRYYSLTACLTACVLIGYARLANGRSGGRVGYAASLVALFHAHYVYAPPLVAACLLHALVWRRAAVRPLLIASGVALAVCAPWIAWQSGMEYGRHYGGQLSSPSLWLANGEWFVRSLLAWLSGLAGILALLGVGLARRFQEGKAGLTEAARDPGVASVVLAGAAILGAVAVVAPGPFFRYLAPLVPLVALGFGGLVAVAGRLHWLAGVAVLAGVGALQPLGAFGYELTHDFDGPVEGIVEYLSAHAEPDDVVWITYGDLPLKFYTPLRVLGGLTGDDLQVALEREAPDWVIVRDRVVHEDRDGQVAQFLANELDWSDFQKVQLPYTDTAFENREDPAEHRFRPARGGVPVTIFRRKHR
jgi:4-amino-4-deoxy-L-arabinose transferase-like glycosyltransferase